VNPPDLQPAFAAFLCIALAGVMVGGSAAVLRLVALSRHHLERLTALQAMEAKLAKILAVKHDKIEKIKKAEEAGAKPS
jgi:hypothetical protein